MAQVSLLKTLRAASVAMLIAGLTVGPSHAQSTGGSAPRGISVVQLSNGTTFNWLVKKNTRATVTDPVLVSTESTTRKLRTTIYGKGSYICSPAGFGKKSRCFAR